MKNALSAATKTLLALLYQSVPFWQSSTKHKTHALGLLGRTGEPLAIPDIASFLLDSNHRVAHAAADAICALVRTLKPTDYASLDQLMRARSPYRWSANDAWFVLKPTAVPRLQSFGESSLTALGIATFHWSGYVRQEALRRLSSARNGAELPFLLLRLNDWVKPVRITADLLVRERLISDYADNFVQNMSLIRRLSLTQRGHYSDIREGIAWLLSSAEGRKAAERGLMAEDFELKRACYQFAFQFGCLSPDVLVEKGLSDRDPSVRLQAIDKAVLLPDAVLERVLRRAREDSYPPVRRKALEISIERFPAGAHILLEKALLDTHPSLRGYAQFRMAKVLEADLAEFYRKALASADRPTLYAAISGLGETGVAADAALILPHLSQSLPKIRRAALRALARLQPEKLLDVFENYLLDDSPAVSREAMRALNKQIHLFTGEKLWAALLGTSEAHVRRNVLFLIARLSKWEGIPYLIRASGADNEELTRLARSYIQRWSARFNSSFTSPTNLQVQRLSETLDTYGILLSGEVLNQIKSGIGPGELRQSYEP